jgi:hypothetical protein
LTDEQIAHLLKPRHDWKAIVGVLISAAVLAWGIAKWAATTPTRDEFNLQRDDMVRVRIELPVMSGKIQRVEESQARVEKAVETIGEKLDERRERRGR